jgi:DNA invertase Pin-like site-specific DNA recombinase
MGEHWAPQIQRCAVYTRKSIEHGLELEFNSLQAQRAICSAYITSQRHKGWVEIPTHYDDAARSGATLDRPELQSLLSDVEHGLVDVVVVYKLDRITRTLLDFVRLMDFFERYGVSFVSITQNFDTEDSMGRLILNVLLTFAQFEREILSDRIRDKHHVMRQSGRWPGGPCPLGYDVRKHVLQIKAPEADTIRLIFALFLELGTYEAVFRACVKMDVRGKRWRTRRGDWIGGRPITKASIYHIIGNPVYIGKIRTGTELYQGLHKPIIDEQTWNQAQQLRRERAAESRAGIPNFNVLTGLLFDCYGRSMSLNHRKLRSGVKYRYYVSNQNDLGRRQGVKHLRARAEPLEGLIVSAVKTLLLDKPAVRAGLLRLGYYDNRLDELAERSELAALRLGRLSQDKLRDVLRGVIVRIELSTMTVRLVLRWNGIARFLAWHGVARFDPDDETWQNCDKTELLELPLGAARSARKLYLPIEPRSGTAKASPGLSRLIQEARHAQSLVDGNREATLCELAGRMRIKADRFSRILRLNYLAPDISTAILDGEHPKGLTRAKLIQVNLPLDWALQRDLLGFPARPSNDGY